jgi:hypothetical protein
VTDARPSIEFALQKYGLRCTLEETLQILRVSDTTLYDGIKRGRYPSQVGRGLWATQAVAEAAVSPERALVGAVDGDDEDDPFA